MTLGKIEIMVARKKGDGEDNQLKRQLMEVVVVACIATIVKDSTQSERGGLLVVVWHDCSNGLLFLLSSSLWLQGIWRLDCGILD